MKLDLLQLESLCLKKEDFSASFKDTLIVIQARMGSLRLLGKILLPLGNESDRVLDILLKRLMHYIPQDHIVVATTTESEDDVIVAIVEKKYPKMKLFRGDEEDVLNRYYKTHLKYQAKYYIRLTSDCPYIDPKLIYFAHLHFLSCNRLVYISNTITRTFPRGFDFEIFTSVALESAYNNAVDSFDREHVTPYIYRTYQEYTESVEMTNSIMSDWRLTLDTKEDYILLTKLTESIQRKYCMRKEAQVTVSIKEIVQILEEHPDWKNINGHIQQKS